jgi:hypothetical protein
MGPHLPEWQVEAQHGEAARGERIGHLNQQSRPAICASAVGQHHRFSAAPRRQMKEAA